MLTDLSRSFLVKPKFLYESGVREGRWSSSGLNAAI